MCSFYVYKRTPNYKEMYLIMMNASERAMDIIIEAQRKFEALCIGASDDDEKKETASETFDF